jgi:hypothetical protein
MIGLGKEKEMERKLNVLCVSFLGLVLVVLIFTPLAFSGTPHTAYGVVEYPNGSHPSSLSFNAFIKTRSGDVLTQSSTGCGYNSGTGQWSVQCGNFTTAWSAGDVLHIDFNDGQSSTASDEVTLTNNPFDDAGTTIIPRPDILVNPNSKDYGSIEVGSNSTQTFIVTNTGGASLVVSLTSLVGVDASEFSIVSGGGDFTLAPSATRNVNVRFSPSSTGSKSTTLRFASNDPDENPKDISLSGNGVVIPDISASPNPASYGNVEVGSYLDKTIVVHNDGTADLVVSSTTLTGIHSSQFGIQSGGGSFTLTPSATRNVVVRFSPTTTGSKSATLRFDTNDPDEDPYDVSLNGSGVVPDIDVSPESKDYGDVEVEGSKIQRFVVTNTGGADLVVSLTSLVGGDAAEFNITNGGGGFTLAPSATRNVDVQFSPSSAGSKSAILRFVSNDPDENPKDISLNGNGVLRPNISVSPSSKNYGNVVVDSNATQTFVVRNDGSADLIVSSTYLTGTHISQFSIQSGGGTFTLTPSGTRNVNVRFNPTSAGVKNAILRFANNDPDENPKDVPLSGTGSVPNIDVNPDSGNYGDVEVEESNTQRFVITNNGGATLTVSSTDIIGSDAGEFSVVSGGGGFILGPGVMRNIDVRFNPSSSGSKSATLRFVSNDPDEGTKDISLSGNGVLITDISVSPTLKNYGDVSIGSSPAQKFTVTNEGTADLSVNSIILLGDDAGEFNFIGGDDPFSLTPENSHDIEVQFSPGSAGIKNAILRFESNDPDENPFDISLTGNGVEIPVPDIQVDPSSHDFGNVPLDSSIIKTFVVTNEGTADLSVSLVSLEGSNAGEFGIVSGEAPFMLLPGSDWNVEVRFDPSSEGQKEAILQFICNDPDEDTLDVSLMGQGYVEDIESPYLTNCCPPSGAVSVAKNAQVQFNVNDNRDGVNLTTLDVYINGDAIVLGGLDQTGGCVSIISHSFQYSVCYNPDEFISEDTTISIQIQCQDCAPGKNQLDSIYTFQIEHWSVFYTENKIIGQEGGVITNKDTDVKMTIPAGALNDSINITIGIVISIPTLPDSVYGIGLNYHFGPDGLQFNDSVTIRIPYTQADLEISGVTGPIELPVYYFSSTKGSWIELNVFDADDHYLFVKVIEFCYLVFGKCKQKTTVEESLINTWNPEEYILFQNYPNPFNPFTTIEYVLPNSVHVELKVYDVLGNELHTLVNEKQSPGRYKVHFDSHGLSNGLYFYRLHAGEFEKTEKMMIMK